MHNYTCSGIEKLTDHKKISIIRSKYYNYIDIFKKCFINFVTQTEIHRLALTKR